MSDKQLMELYIDTLKKCGLFLIKMSNEDIEYNIFEEFDIGVTTFLHDTVLQRLKAAGFIDDVIEEKSKYLRRQYLLLQNSNIYTVHAIKNDMRWRNLLKLSDEIKEMLCQN